MSDEIRIKTPYEQKALAAEAAACRLGNGGHDWRNMTSTADSRLQYVCARCGVYGEGGEIRLDGYGRWGQ